MHPLSPAAFFTTWTFEIEQILGHAPSGVSGYLQTFITYLVGGSKTQSRVCVPLRKQLQNRFAMTKINKTRKKKRKEKKQKSCLIERLHPAGGNLVNSKYNKCQRIRFCYSLRSKRCRCSVSHSQRPHFDRRLNHVLSDKSHEG